MNVKIIYNKNLNENRESTFLKNEKKIVECKTLTSIAILIL